MTAGHRLDRNQSPPECPSRGPQPAVISGPDRADVRCAHRIVPVGRSHIARPVRPPKRGLRRRTRDDPRPHRLGLRGLRRQVPTRPVAVHVRHRTRRVRRELHGAQRRLRRVRQVPDHAVELAGLGAPVPRQREREADPGEPGKVAARQDDLAVSAGSAAGSGSPTGGSPARRERPAGPATRSATSRRSCASTARRAARSTTPKAEVRKTSNERSKADRVHRDLATREAQRVRRRRRRLREVGRGERHVHVQRPEGHVERTDRPDARQGQGLRRRQVREDREHVPPLVRRPRRRSSGPAGRPPASTRSRSSSSARRATPWSPSTTSSW